MVNLIGGVYEVLYDDKLFVVTITKERGEEFIDIVYKNGEYPDELICNQVENYFNQINGD